MKVQLKKIILPCIALALSANGIAQNKSSKHDVSDVPAKRTCGTHEHHEYLKQTRPGYEKDFNDYNQAIQEYLNSNASKMNSMVPITVPVVMHIVYQNATENLADQRAIDQLQVLNNDFQRHNVDTAIGSAFYNVAGRTNIQFCLAQRDPNGNPTTGIVHKSTTVATFSTNDAVKKTAQGGDDAWDPTKYVNIWICDLGTQLLGYGEFPTGTISQTFGLVLNYRYTGTTGASAPFNKGRTGTHEFGHCFNLFHIWGDDGGACTGSDQCSDTPNQASENYGCPTLPLTDACTTTAPGVMCMNYMDYVDDACMVMFSAQQAARMTAVVSTAPYNILQSSNGCTPVNLVNLDASIFAVTSPTGNLCSTTFTPNVTLKNMGSTALTSCTINYKVDNGAVSTYAWTGNLASLATTVVTLPSITSTVGTHTLTVYTSNPNAGVDGNATNDQSTSTFTIIGASGLNLPFAEGFEGTAFVPSGWVLNNPNANDTWVRTTAAKKSGVASASMDNFTNPISGERDEMITPAINLTTQSSPQLTFQVAYQLYTNPVPTQTYADTLEVLISSDCGQTYTSIYKKFGATLTTATPNYSTTQFVPTAAQWRQETVSLAPYATVPNAYFKFRNGSGYENMLYLDDINIAGVVGLNQASVAPTVEIWPNPSQGMISLNIANAVTENATVTVYNIVGETAISTVIKNANGVYTLDLSTLANGVYNLEVKTDNAKTTKKIVINK